MDELNDHYLKLLSELYPDRASARCELARLDATLSLPKGVQMFVSDIHGEFNAFAYMVKSASGLTKELIDETFGEGLDEQGKLELLTLVCFPRERATYLLRNMSPEEADEWEIRALNELITLCTASAKRHSLAEVEDVLPSSYAPIMKSMLFSCAGSGEGGHSERRLQALIASALESGIALDLIDDFGKAIRYLAIERIHLVGDVYDRGPAPEAILDILEVFPSLDIQWGNHEIVWMGAALGQKGCIAHVVRNCARYGNLSILEDSYGINLRPLASFAMNAYADDPCVGFGLKGSPNLSPEEEELNVKIQKAMAIMQFKVEAQLIDEHPEYGLDDRKLLHRIDHEKGTVIVDDTVYDLTDTVFPTVDPDDPYALTEEERAILDGLARSFVGSERLRRHMRLLIDRGSLYEIENGILMFHACVPLDEDGSLKEVEIDGRSYKGKALYDAVQSRIESAFATTDSELDPGSRDLLWYLWLGPGSPLFAKSKMATFELYLIADKQARKEVRNSFYDLIDEDAVVDGIFEDFGMEPETSHIVCGHVPVKVKDGESPIRNHGRVLFIDGGYSAAYQKTTGIAGMTLIAGPHGLALFEHGPLESLDAVVEDCATMRSERVDVTYSTSVITRGETDEGVSVELAMDDIEQLVSAYESGKLKERRPS